MKNIKLLLAVFFVVLLTAAYSGTVYWDDGEIVRGGAKMSAALDEKVDLAGTNYVVLIPTATFATASAEVGTIYQNATGAINFLSTGTTWLNLYATSTNFEW